MGSELVNPSSSISTPVSIANGGTGSTTQNFVDLTTGQTVAGAKSFSSESTLGGGVQINTRELLESCALYGNSIGSSTLNAAITNTATSFVIDDTNDNFQAGAGVTAVPAANWRVPFAIKIDNEIMIIRTATGLGTSTCTFSGILRGTCGTTKASHVINSSALPVCGGSTDGDELIFAYRSPVAICTHLAVATVNIYLASSSTAGVAQAPTSNQVQEVCVISDPGATINFYRCSGSTWASINPIATLTADANGNSSLGLIYNVNTLQWSPMGSYP